MPGLVWAAGSTPPGMVPAAVRRIEFPKSPNDLTPVTGDFRGALSSIDSDMLATSFIPIVAVQRNDGGAADLYVVGTPLINQDATRVTVWLAAGTAGSEYLISISVMSIDGQELTRSFIIPVNIR